MFVDVPQLDVQQASLLTSDVGQLAIGPITVGDAQLRDVDSQINAVDPAILGVGYQHP